MAQQRQSDDLLLPNLCHALRHLRLIGWIDESSPLVAQLSGSGPRAPTAYGLLQPSGPLGTGGICLIHHKAIALHSYLTGIRQVAIDGNQRIKTLDIRRTGIGFIANIRTHYL